MTFAEAVGVTRDVVLLGGLVVASYTDLRWTWIPNALVFPMMFLGFLLGALDGRLGMVALGWLLATVLYVPLWQVGISKAGDAKLMMAIGALMGLHAAMEAVAWTAILYVPVQLVVLAVRGRLGNLVATARYEAHKALGQDAGPAPEVTMGVTGPIIAAAGALTWGTAWLEWIPNRFT